MTSNVVITSIAKVLNAPRTKNLYRKTVFRMYVILILSQTYVYNVKYYQRYLRDIETGVACK